MHEYGFATALVQTWSICFFKWNDWAEKEVKHMRGYVKNTVTYNLTFIMYGNAVWEESTSSSTATQALLLLALIVLAGRAVREHVPRGGTRGTSGDAEAIEWSSAAEAGTRIAKMLEFSRIRHPEIFGRTC